MRDDVIHDAPSSAGLVNGRGWEISSPKVATIRPEKSSWDPERFALEQIRGLVRQVFTTKMTPPVRQIVFSAVDPHVDVGTLSLRVAECLARETSANIGVLMGGLRSFSDRDEKLKESGHAKRPESLRESATRCGSNLWVLNAADDGLDRAIRRCRRILPGFAPNSGIRFWKRRPWAGPMRLPRWRSLQTE